MYNPPILNKPSLTTEEFIQYQKELSLYNHKYAIEVIKEAPSPISWETLEEVLCIVGNNNRWSVFCTIVESPYNLTLEAYNKGLAFSYTTGRADHYRAIELFLESDISLLLNEEDKAFYNSLPETITLYRGTSKEEYENEEYGTSWSTDRGVAEFFAFRFSKENRVVLELQVSKKYVLAVFTGRKEKEVVIDYDSTLEDLYAPSPLVITEDPTSFYDEYINNK